MIFKIILISVLSIQTVWACQPVDQGLLSSDLSTQKSQLLDANFECDNLSNFLNLAKVYQKLGAAENANEVMEDAIRLINSDEQRVGWLIAKTELALANNDTCEASQKITELSGFETAKNTHHSLRKKLYQSIEGRIIDSTTISCALTPSRSVTQRGMKIKPRLDVSILFDFNSDVLTQQGKNQASSIIEAMNTGNLKDKNITFIGHTDQIGTPIYNMVLSQKRAQSVANYMIGINSSLATRLNTRGQGESQLLSLGTTDLDHKLNRRVELNVE